MGPADLAVKQLHLHLVNVGSIPTGPTHGEGRLQSHPGDVLKFTPNVRKSPRSGLNLEGRLSDPHIQFTGEGGNPISAPLSFLFAAHYSRPRSLPL